MRTLSVKLLLRQRDIPILILISALGGSFQFEIFLRFAVVVALLTLVGWSRHCDCHADNRVIWTTSG